ncbi:MAG TPA: hypothetical protein VGE07_02665 [Herpetosiphonaceae bacterium]
MQPSQRPSSPDQPEYAVPALPNGLLERWGRIPLALRLPLSYLAFVGLFFLLYLILFSRSFDSVIVMFMALWVFVLPGMMVLMALKESWGLPLEMLLAVAALVTALLLSGIGWLITLWRNAPE